MHIPNLYGTCQRLWYGRRGHNSAGPLPCTIGCHCFHNAVSWYMATKEANAGKVQPKCVGKRPVIFKFKVLSSVAYKILMPLPPSACMASAAAASTVMPRLA